MIITRVLARLSDLITVQYLRVESCANLRQTLAIRRDGDYNVCCLAFVDEALVAYAVATLFSKPCDGVSRRGRAATRGQARLHGGCCATNRIDSRNQALLIYRKNK